MESLVIGKKGGGGKVPGRRLLRYTKGKKRGKDSSWSFISPKRKKKGKGGGLGKREDSLPINLSQQKKGKGRGEGQ